MKRMRREKEVKESWEGRGEVEVGGTKRRRQLTGQNTRYTFTCSTTMNMHSFLCGHRMRFLYLYVLLDIGPSSFLPDRLGSL